MSFIGSNIRKIRAIKQLSQAAFAELFQLARPSVGAWEEGRAEPKTDTLLQIARHFGVSVDLLLTKELTDDDLYHFDLYQRQRDDAAPAAPVPTADQQPHLTPFVRADQWLEYGMRCQDPLWIDQLPALTLPHQLGGATRAFEVGGSEMAWPAPAGGLRPRDVVLAARASAMELRPDDVYAVVLRRGPVVRRLAEMLPNQELRLTADNPDYPETTIALSEVLEVWQVHRLLTAVPGPPTEMEVRLARLERLLEK